MENINYIESFNKMDEYIEQIIKQHPDMPYEMKCAIGSLCEFVALMLHARFYWDKSFFPVNFNYLDFILRVVKKIKRRNYLDKKAENVLLSVNLGIDEQKILELFGMPATIIKTKKDYNLIKWFKILKLTNKTMNYLVDIPFISKNDYKFVFIHLIEYYSTYFYTDLSGIKNIITENDAYYFAAPIVAKANNININTIKINYYVIIGGGDSPKIYSKYYFPLDKIHRDYCLSYECNKNVKVIGQGGRLSSDYLTKYTNTKQIPKKKKIIVYLSSHTLFEDFDLFYVPKLKKFVENNKDYILVIKTHPGDKKSWKEYESKNVKVSRVTGDKYFKLATQSDYIFSLYSTLLYQTKLINDNCFALSFMDNIKCKTAGIIEGQTYYEKYVPMVKSEEMLYDILSDKIRACPKEIFIQEQNPDFGHLKETFFNLIGELK